MKYFSYRRGSNKVKSKTKKTASPAEQILIASVLAWQSLSSFGGYSVIDLIHMHLFNFIGEGDVRFWLGLILSLLCTNQHF